MLAPALFKTTEGRFGEPRNGSIRHILIVIIEKLRPISNGSIFDGSVPPSLFQVECSLLRTGRRRDIYHASRVATAQFARSDRVLPAAYQHAIDSGVYLQGVDSSYVGDRKPVALEAIGRNPAVLLAIGQSNIANHGGKQFSSGQAVFNFNPFDGQCYPAADPLLGATGDLGSPLCILGDALINSGFAGSIVLCALAVGGATVANWAPGGPYHTKLTYALARLKGLGLYPSHVIWHQGEADALYSTSARDYVKAFYELSGSLRDMAVTGPIFVAGASYFALPEGYQAQQREVRNAQQDLLSEANLILQGPDTDLIRDRYDGCHFGATGLVQHAKAWHDVLMRTAADSARSALQYRPSSSP